MRLPGGIRTERTRSNADAFERFLAPGGITFVVTCQLRTASVWAPVCDAICAPTSGVIDQQGQKQVRRFMEVWVKQAGAWTVAAIRATTIEKS